jgi:hypothetical protein
MSKQHEQITFEEVNAHFEKVNLSDFAEGGHSHKAIGQAAINPAAAIAAVCKAYKVIKPFLTLVVNLFFVPAAWKAAINGFMSVMNGLCP